MKTKKVTIENLRKMIRETLEKVEKEGVTQSKRAKHGYQGEEPVDYDVAEGVEEEGVSQSKRKDFGYGLEEPTDYDAGGGLQESDMTLTNTVNSLKEVSPPSKEAEKFIKKNKEKFKKTYGPRWNDVLYSTAWSKFGPKKEKGGKK